MNNIESETAIKQNNDDLNTIMNKIIDSLNNTDIDQRSDLLNEHINIIRNNFGLQKAYNTLLCLQVAFNFRKPTLAIYDHTFHLIGGGEKYGLTLVNALKEIFDITIITNKKLTHENILNWYNLDLSNCRIKNITIPFFEEIDPVHLDPNRISKEIRNPFHIISKESGNYDFFINNSMNEMVYPLSNISIMICHFPERRPSTYFYSDKYTYTVYNSEYTSKWIKKKWKYTPHKHIFPPVDMSNTGRSVNKENIILSVARFEPSGSKKQIDMIKAFKRLKRSFPEKLKGWKLILAGGSQDTNPFLDKIYSLLTKSDKNSIEIKTNVSGDLLKELYKKSSIFWHLCGLNQTDPSLIEHFGMTIVEAMQNSIVPIVFDGGGQKEIVEHGISGYRVNSISDLTKYTVQIIKQRDHYSELSKNALIRSDHFSRERFEINVKNFFNKILKEYKTLNPEQSKAN